jgi:hypothetical protein
MQRADTEEEDDGGTVLLSAKVVQLVHSAVETAVHGEQQDALLQCTRRSMQEGVPHSVGRPQQHASEEVKLLLWGPSEALSLRSFPLRGLGHHVDAALLTPLLVTKRGRHLVNPVICRPCSHSTAHFQLAEGARRHQPQGMGEGQAIKDVRLFNSLHDGAISTGAISYDV